MSALTDDRPEFRRVHEWHLPTERDQFLGWLARAAVSLERFLAYPASEDMPAELRTALGKRAKRGK